MKKFLLATVATLTLSGVAHAMTVCTVQHDGFAYEGPSSANEPKQLFPIWKGEKVIVAKWGDLWKYVQFENRLETPDDMGWVRTDNLKCKVAR
jgi:hypothetical protein